MLTSILGARLRWHQANGWVFDPVIVGPDIIEYTLTKAPHAGRHAIQHFYYQRVAPGIETTAWYEESGAIVHITWYLETQTTHRFGLFLRGSPKISASIGATTRTRHSSRKLESLFHSGRIGPGASGTTTATSR